MSESSSPESETLRSYSAELVTAISATDPLGLALKLFTKNFVERATVEDVCLPTNPPTTKSCIIVTAVDRKVEADPSSFHQFTGLLQDEEDSILKTISTKLIMKYTGTQWDLQQSHASSQSQRCLPRKRSLDVSVPQSQSPSHQPPPSKHFHLVHQLQFPTLCLYADKLRLIYAESELPKYSNPSCYKWTLSPSKSYIDLTIINKKGMTTKRVNEYTKVVLNGQIDKISHKEFTTVKIEEILQAKPDEKLKCVLVEGAPGIGKSTLAWQICNHWGKRELFQNYSILLLLPLRDHRVQKATCVADLFINADSRLQRSVRHEVAQDKWNGIDTLIILEGLDELPSHLLSQPSIFTGLLSGTVLPQATILVTSRPSATEQLHKFWRDRVSRHYEISGFTRDSINEYAQSVELDNEQLSGFNQYINMHPHIESMLYIPLHCVIAITVYLQCQQSCKPLPKTLTGLYTCLMQTILIQYLNDHPQFQINHHSFDTVFGIPIPPLVHNHFKELCRIAFDHIRDQQLVFSDMPKELHDFGFTNAIPELLLYQQLPNYSYYFLHLSVQEFLAAYYVSLMSFCEQEQLLKTEYNKPCFANMFRFVAGITKFVGLQKDVVRQALGVCDNSSEQLGSYSLEVLYECQDVGILDPRCTYSVILHLLSSPHLYLALGYCIANSSCGWKLELVTCDGCILAEMLIQGIKESKLCHTSYSIRSIHCIDCSLAFLNKLFTEHTPEKFIADIESLTLAHIQFKEIPSYLVELIPRMKRLNSLILQNILDTSLITLLPALPSVSKIRNVKIMSNSGKLEMLFPTDDTSTIKSTSKFINQFLSQLPQQTIAHIGSLEIMHPRSQPQPLPPCLPKLIPKMERLKTLTLENTSPIDLLSALSKALTLRNLRIVSISGDLEMIFPTDNLFPTGTIKSTSIFFPHLPQQTIAHIGSLVIVHPQWHPQPLPSCLPELIPKMDRLRTLTLENVLDTSLTELIPVLSSAPILSSLTLPNLNSEGIALFGQCTWPPGCHLETIKLPCLSPNHIKMLSKALTKVSSLKALNIEGSNFNFHSMQVFCTAILQSLAEVHATYCSIDDVDTYCLAEALNHNTRLIKLNMSRNPVGGRGALALAKMLKCNTTLEELNLSFTDVNSEGAIAMAEALDQNTTLRKLDMSWNPIKDSGTLAMAEMLKQNTTLLELDLSSNYLYEISTDAIKVLIGSLAVNQYLMKLTLSHEYIHIRNLSTYYIHRHRLKFR